MAIEHRVGYIYYCSSIMGVPVHGFLKKAQDNLILAKYCLENSYYDASANRAYYAAFQAAVAALSAQGITSDKYEHKWVQAN